MDQHETRQPMLFLECYNFYQAEIVTLSVKRLVLLIGHNLINQTYFFSTSLTSLFTDKKHKLVSTS